MSIARHTFYNAAGSITPTLVTLVTTPIYLAVIGIERFGILALCWTLLGQMGFLNLGLGPALTQKLARHRDDPDTDPSRLFWTAAWLNVGMAMVAGVLVFAVAPSYFGTLSDLPLDIRREIGPAIPFLAASVPVAMMVSVPNGALQGRERFLAQNVIGSLGSILVSVLPLLVGIALGPRLDFLIAAALAGRAISLALVFRVCVPAVPVRTPAFDRTLVRPLLVFGGWMMVVNMIAPLIVTADRFVIGSLVGAAAVTAYVIPYQLSQRLRIVPNSLVQAMFPRMAYSSPQERNRLVDDGVAALVCVMTPLAIAAIAVVGPFMHLWVGSSMAVQSNPIAYILIAAFWVNSFARVPWTLLQAEGRPDLCAKLIAMNVMPYAVALYFGIILLGITGAAVAWAFRALLETTSLFSFTSRALILLRLVFPAVLVCSAMAIALAMPLDSVARWAGLASLAAVSGILSYAIAPPSLRRLARPLLPWKRIAA